MSEERIYFNVPNPTPSIVLMAGPGHELRIQPDGIIYKGVKVEDAGEVYKALREVLSGHMPTPEGSVLVTIEPVTGPNYEAGMWSRRNWEAALEDQRSRK